jgi:hypothetical protein
MLYVFGCILKIFLREKWVILELMLFYLYSIFNTHSIILYSTFFPPAYCDCARVSTRGRGVAQELDGDVLVHTA